MMRSGIAHRYAKALFQAALDAGAEEEVFDDVESVLGLATKVPRLREFLLSPQVPTEDKHALVEKALDGRAHKLLVDFLHLLVEKKRIVFVMDIAETFRDIYRKHRGMAAVKAITAVPLGEAQEKRLLRLLAARTHKIISLTQVVDPDIIGGMILVVDDNVLDGSVRHQIESLKRSLLETRVVRAGEAPADRTR
jgi:F-type H+-transporting ATPase subunit delta